MSIPFIDGFEPDGSHIVSPAFDYSASSQSSFEHISVTAHRPNGYADVHSKPLDHETNSASRLSVAGRMVQSLKHERTPSPDGIETAKPPPDQYLGDYLIKLKKHVQKISVKQEDVLATRIMAHQHRVRLKHQREEVADIGAELIKRLGVYFAEIFPSNATPLRTLFEQFQQARDAYQALEDNYHQFEDKLDQKEYELHKAEEVLHSVLKHIGNYELSSDYPGGVEAADYDSSSQAASGVSAVPAYHPHVAEYLSRLGDAELLRERLWNMRAEQAILAEEQISREKIGLLLDPESQAFLSQFEQYEGQICEELAVVENDVKLLRTQCENEGLLERTDDLKQDFDFEELLREPTAAQSADALVTPWSKRTPVFFEENPTRSQDAISTTGYINKWLLHQLCQSSFEVHRLRSAPELENLKIDDQGFCDLVLDWWSKDAAAKPMTQPHSGESRCSILPEVNDEVDCAVISLSIDPRWSPLSNPRPRSYEDKPRGKPKLGPQYSRQSW